MPAKRWHLDSERAPARQFVIVLPRCEECGNQLPADAPEGLCPACLIRQALLTLPPERIRGPLIAGERVSHYEILYELGRGGMGMVYRARDTELQRVVALKVLPPESAMQKDARRRFFQEARAASALNHPNIITIYEIGSQDGMDFISMELVEGTTLDKLIPPGGMSLSEVIHYAVQVADALTTAHAAHIIHRDIKPGNIMVTREHRVKILDFGLAKSTVYDRGALADTVTSRQLPPRTESGVIIGTATYMSPEQVEGKPVDTRSDVFSFGSVLYEMVVGRPAFARETRLATMAAIVNNEPPPLCEARLEAPRELERIVSRCLCKDPERRFQDAADLRLALEGVRQKCESVTQKHISYWRWAGRTLRRPVTRRIAAIVGLVLLIATAALLWFFGDIGNTREYDHPPVAITTYPAVEEDPTLSPDGRHVAFSGNIESADNFDIYEKVIGAESTLRLTRDPDPDMYPVWSPDGRWIAFTRFRKAILLISSLGGPERVITEGDFITTGWSPDSEYVLISAGSSPIGAFAVSIKSGERKTLITSNVIRVALSHRGDRIAIIKLVQTGSALYIAPISKDLQVGKEVSIDSSGLKELAGCAWTEDDHELICSATTHLGEPLSLWRITSGHRSHPRIVPFSEGASGPVISPVSHRLVFDRYKAETHIWRAFNPELYRGTAVAAPARFLASTRSESDVQYSPDGKRIAFTSNRSGAFELWVAGINGDDLRMLTSLGGVSDPKWSPDSKSIVFEREHRIYVIDWIGGIPKAIDTQPPLSARQPAFSHDRESIYFSTDTKGRVEVWRVGTRDARAIQITHEGGYLPVESADGRSLFYIRSALEHVQAIWRMDLQNGSEQRVSPAHVNVYTFVPAQGGVYFIAFQALDQIAGIDFIPDRAGTSRRVLTLHLPQRFTVPTLSVSPDRKSFLYALWDDFADDIMQFENFH